MLRIVKLITAFNRINITINSQKQVSFVMEESIDLLKDELKKIEKWEKDQKGLWFWEKLSRLPFVLLDKLTPAFIQEKVGLAIDELGSYIQTGGQYLVKDETVLKKFGLDAGDFDRLQNMPLSEMDKAAHELRQSRTNFAAIQGATTGIGGIFTLAIDIPMLLGVSLKVLQEIALCYGFNPKEKEERIFVVKCLQFSSSDIVGKRVILDELSKFDESNRNSGVISELQGWREVVATYRDNWSWKKLLQLIPIAGIIFGAVVNRSTVEDVAETGIMMYRKRRILERIQQLESPKALLPKN